MNEEDYKKITDLDKGLRVYDPMRKEKWGFIPFFE